MPPKKPKLRLTEAQCEEWRKYGVQNGKVLNPKTGNYVNEDGAVAKSIEEACNKTNVIKTFKTEEDVRNWLTDSTVHPINNKNLDPLSDDYLDIYNKAFKIMRNVYKNDDMKIINLLPKTHCLFTNEDGTGGIDMLYYNFTLDNGIQNTPVIQDKKYNNPILYDILNSRDIPNEIRYDKQKLEKGFMEGMINSSIFLSKKFPDVFDQILNVNNYSEVLNVSVYKKLKEFIYFTNTCYGTDKDTKQKFILSSRMNNENINNIIKDFEELASGDIIENKENIVIQPIEDPVEQYFKKFKDKLKFLQDSKISRINRFNNI